MAAWDISALDLRRESLFGDRVVFCRAGRPASLQQMLEQAAARAPDREAIIAGNLRLSWIDLLTLVEQIAASLAERGIAKGDRVALLLGNRAEFVLALYAITRLGAIAVPMSPRERGPGIAHMLNHSGAKMLISDEAFADRLPDSHETPQIQSHIILPVETAAPFADIRGQSAAPPAQIGELDLAAILYTSGTTGKPKGAVIAHINIIHAAMIYQTTMGLGDGERSIAAVPMTHVTGIAAIVAPMARCAGTIIILPEFRAPEFLAIAAAERMTHTVLVPAMYNLCLARADFNAVDLGAWRIGGYGGAPMPGPTIERLAAALPNLGMMNLYGSTESVCAQAIMPPQYAYQRRHDVGLPVPGAEIIIMDPDGHEVPRGTPGEIWLRNATVIQGYWRDPAATQSELVAGFWRSGDLGQMDAEGFLRVLDRIKDMINRGGFKIYTAEVESVLAQHPAVLESAVVSKPCPILGERVHAFIALRGGAVDEAELAAFCAARLADYKRPESFTLSREKLPRNANGKLLKREMRESLLVKAQ
jgi:acyl-CoA synthetase (AMP-forming)/AMP-acid ligase II